MHRIVTEGVVMGEDSALEHMASDKELMQLTQSEHPILRANALAELLRRKPANPEDILLNHLDDTAYILLYVGEFGYWWRTVADYIVNEEYLHAYGPRWKPKEAHLPIIDRLLLRHNYLSTAYRLLMHIEPQEKYYAAIKDMATRPRKLDFRGFEMNFNDIEYALYGLAKFKKKEDVPLIKEKILEKKYELSHISFMLMKEFPDTAYADIFSTIRFAEFNKFSGRKRRNGITGFDTGYSTPEDFLEALVAQKNDHSSRLLDSILTILPAEPRLLDKQGILRKVTLEIWNYPCPAYTKLREKIKPEVDAYIKDGVTMFLNKDGATILR